MLKPVAVALILIASVAVTMVYAEVSGSELAAIDYEAMIGGPLAAIIKAQAMAAQSTADFIKSVGLDENNNVVNVDFDYEVLNATTGEKYTNTLTVPLLTIIPIPFIKIEECTIEFNAKLNSVSQTAVNLAVGLSANATGKGNVKGFTASMSASFSTQFSYGSNSTETREFSMKIEVKAKQDEMPAGLARILSILEDASMLELAE